MNSNIIDNNTNVDTLISNSLQRYTEADEKCKSFKKKLDMYEHFQILSVSDERFEQEGLTKAEINKWQLALLYIIDKKRQLYKELLNLKKDEKINLEFYMNEKRKLM